MASSSKISGSAWKGGGGSEADRTCGIRVDRTFMRDHVEPDLEIVLYLDGWPEPVRLPYSPSIHDKCPEFRGAAVTKWFRELGLLHWEHGKPPKFIVEALEKQNHFFVRRA